MTVRPEFGPEYGEEERFSRHIPPEVKEEEDEEERELHEHEREDQEAGYLDAESNEAHAPGQACERCGQVITAQQDARRRPDGRWVHEECPPILSHPAPEGDPPPPA